nr:hypothetical protein GCM10020093_067680 [Planobispora longispora]
MAGAVPAAAEPQPESLSADAARHGGRGSLRFAAVAPNREDRIVVPEGYQSAAVVRWGDPVLPDAPAFDYENQTAAAQAKQFGYNCDFVTFFPMGGHRGLLWVNHEYTDEALMFRGYAGGATATEEQIKIGMAAHGGSIVEIERVGHSGQWRLVTRGSRRYNRRVTAQTPMKFTGPAAGSDLLKTAADPSGTVVLGMLNNCAGGTTPWGTVLTAEENFNQYFAKGGGAPRRRRRPGAVRHQHHLDRSQRARLGAARGALRPVQALARGQPLRLDRGDRPVRPRLHPGQAHRPGPVRPRGRHHHPGQGRPGRGLHG